MNKNERRPRAISYARFSSGKQAHGNSIVRQDERFLLWLNSHPEYDPLSFVDRGVSAFKGKNAADGHLSEIVELVKKGELGQGDLLVIESLDRLSRQRPLETFKLLNDILSSGLNILTLEDGQTYDKQTANVQVIMLAAKADAAYSYSKRLGERVGSAHLAKRTRAALQQSTGIVTVPWIKNGKLHEPFAGIVREAIRLYLMGYGHRAIVKVLQNHIATDLTLQTRYPKPLNATTVKRWLKSPELVGDWDSKTGIIQGAFEPLLTHVEYQKVQNELNRRTSAPSRERVYELSGLVKCKLCEASFHTRIQKPVATKAAPIGSDAYLSKPAILYCNCSNYLKNGNCDNNKTWPYDVLLFIYRYGLGEVLAAIYMGTQKPVDIKKIEKTQESIAILQTQIQRRGNLYLADGNALHIEEITALTKEMEILNGAYRQLVAETAEQTALNQSDTYVHSLQEIEELPKTQLRDLIKKYGYEILIEGDEAHLSFSPEGRERFRKIRRSQKHLCYILEVTLPEWIEQPQEPDWIKYYAIGKGGKVLGIAETETALLKQLDGLPP